MLKRLLDLMGEAEVTGRTRGERGTGALRAPGAEFGRRAIGQRRADDFGAVHAYAINEGIGDEKAYILGAALADSMAQGNSNVYAIVYAAAYGIACSKIGASEEWARAYAQACAHATAARESIGFASVYGYAIADGASPEDARVFAQRYAV